MDLKPIITRIKAVHWAWWMLWLGTMALLGLMVLSHLRFIHSKGMIQDWADLFRPPGLLLPVEIIMLRGFTNTAGFAALISLAFAAAAVIQPAKGSLSMAMAVGTIVLFFAYHVLLFKMVFEWQVSSAVRTRSAATAPTTLPAVPPSRPPQGPTQK